MPEWLLVVIALAPLVGILAGVIWKQLNDKIMAHKDHCDEEIEKLWNQIGKDSFSGMRRTVHSVESLPERFMSLDRDVEHLRQRMDEQ